MTYLDPIPFVLRSGGRADEGTNRGTTNRGKRRDTTVPSEIGGGVAPAITDVAANIPSSPAVDRRGQGAQTYSVGAGARSVKCCLRLPTGGDERVTLDSGVAVFLEA